MSTVPAIDVRAFIDERSISRYQWLLVALCFLVVAADGIDVAIMGFVAPSILQEWGVSRPAFGLVMSAAPFGLVIGALVAGPASDRIGRKRVLIASVLLFGLFTIATSFSNSLSAMATLRVLTGIGLGAAMPNTTTLLSEYVPTRKRSLMIAIMFTGFNLGSALIGLVAGYLIPHQGWRSVLMFGGTLPLALIPLLLWLLPESARLLAAQGVPAARVGAVLGRVCGTRFADGATFVAREAAPAARSPVAVLFTREYRGMSLALWLTYFMGLMVIYLLTGWLPTLLKDAGMAIGAAASVTALFQIGGTIGAVVVGWAMDHARPARVISFAYVGGGLFVLALGSVGALSPMVTWLVFSTGFCMSGAQTGLNAYAPGLYPTVARATGVSWMLGMGRFGSIIGSAVGGALLGLGLGFQAILGMLLVPALCAAVAVLASQARR